MATEQLWGWTGEALRLADNIDTQFFRNAMDRGQYQSAPGTLPGNRQRRWTESDIVALRFFRLLTEMGMASAPAGELTKQLQVGILKDPEAREQGVYLIRHPKTQKAEFRIRPEPPDGAELIMTLPVGTWRRAIRAELREIWRAEQRSNQR